MNNSMQRIAELEAEVAFLKAERDALKEKSLQTDIQAIADVIEVRLNRVERNLREDFVGKFAGVLLPATESITNRVVTLGKRELQLEKQLKKVETSFENHINDVSTKLDEAGTKQQDFLTALDALITRHREEQKNTINTNKSILQANYNIAKVVNDAANHCTKFADDYEEVSTKAKSRINEYTIEMKSSLKAYLYSLELLKERQGIKTNPEVIKPAVRSQGFRLAIVKSYAHRCTTCGIKILTADGHTIVEAAHVIPFSISKNDDPRNGLCLCRSCHWSFDEGLISVSSEYKVVTSPQLAANSNLPSYIATLADRRIIHPIEEKLMPDLDNLAWHRKEVFRIL